MYRSSGNGDPYHAIIDVPIGVAKEKILVKSGDRPHTAGVLAVEMNRFDAFWARRGASENRSRIRAHAALLQTTQHRYRGSLR